MPAQHGLAGLRARLVVARRSPRRSAAGRPVVALESTLISHGLPFPQNVEVARASEAAVRESGAVPATVAIRDGRILVGLDEATLAALATAAGRPQGGPPDARRRADRRRLGRHHRVGHDARRPRRRDPGLRHGRDRRRPPPAPSSPPPARTTASRRPASTSRSTSRSWPAPRSSSSAPGRRRSSTSRRRSRCSRRAASRSCHRHRRAARLLLARLGDPGAPVRAGRRGGGGLAAAAPRAAWERACWSASPSRPPTSCPARRRSAAIARATAEAEAAGHPWPGAHAVGPSAGRGPDRRQVRSGPTPRSSSTTPGSPAASPPLSGPAPAGGR